MTDDACTVIDTTHLPADRVDDFVDQWRVRVEIVSKAPGFRDARLHRALTPDASHPLVMVANWDSIAARDAALADAGANMTIEILRPCPPRPAETLPRCCCRRRHLCVSPK